MDKKPNSSALDRADIYRRLKVNWRIQKVTKRTQYQLTVLFVCVMSVQSQSTTLLHTEINQNTVAAILKLITCCPQN